MNMCLPPDHHLITTRLLWQLRVWETSKEKNQTVRLKKRVHDSKRPAPAVHSSASEFRAQNASRRPLVRPLVYPLRPLGASADVSDGRTSWFARAPPALFGHYSSLVAHRQQQQQQRQWQRRQ